MTTALDLTTTGSANAGLAVIYLRVSTKEQAERGGTAEGFSIPAQREACRRKADQLGVEIIAEFVDRGESAKTAARPGLQQMLTALKDTPVTSVIVHKIDRLARNREDDVNINVAIRASGASLVSCTENIDETPSGALMHGIMSSIAEFYSRNLANEVVKGSTQKAMAGGTVGKAPTGYLNVRKTIDHREIRTVEIDAERGPLMTWVFEQYATGNWSLRRLLDAVTDKGLTSVGGPNTASKKLSLSNFNRLLKNDYYVGVVTYRGVKYPGLHEPLITVNTFDAVQGQLEANSKAGERPRKHRHYLKGSLICTQCVTERKELSWLGISVTKNRHGTIYPYFMCLGRHEKRSACTQAVVLIGDVEDQLIAEHYRRAITPTQRADLAELIHEELTVYMSDSTQEAFRQQTRIQKLKRQRDKILHAYYADAIGLDQLQPEQERINRSLIEANRLLDQANVSQQRVESAIGTALDKIENCGERYEQAPPKLRREMNQALFDHIEIGPNTPATGRLAAQYQMLTRPEVLQLAHERAQQRRQHQVETDQETDENNKTLAAVGQGLSYDYLVGTEGLEPPTCAV